MSVQRGFTLVEMIVVIVITGIVAGIVAVFIQAPVQGYIDSSRRADLTDIADTALRRMARDVRIAVPNSLRTAACPGPCFEFVMTKTGGRYRSDPPGDPLTFDSVDTTFEILHGPAGTAVVVGDFVAIGSSQSNASVIYDLSAIRSVTGYASPAVTLNAGLAPARQMPTHRFDVIDTAVTYNCTGVGVDANGNGTGILLRHAGYWNFAVSRAVFTAPAGGNVLAQRVSACTISYNLANPSFSSFGLLSVSLTLTEANESVTLHHQMHVNNIP